MKLLIVAAVISGAVIGLWIVGRLTHAFHILRVKNPANEPTIRPGKFLVITKLRKPRRFDLVSYRAVVPPGGMTMLTHRLCGIPGDLLEIKAGVLYVNGQNADKSLKLQHIFKMPAADSKAIAYDEKQAYAIPPYTNTLYIALEDGRVKREKLNCERYVLPRGLRDEDIYLAYKQNWNRDHFGPLRVPKGMWFLLGDNREIAAIAASRVSSRNPRTSERSSSFWRPAGRSLSHRFLLFADRSVRRYQGR